MKRPISDLSLVLALIVVVGMFAISRLDLSALPEPSATETYLATRAKHVLVRWSIPGTIPVPPSDVKASIQEGEKLFGTDCAVCHGLDGKSPTDAGRWMYPRASDLTSLSVQQYSDRELFWIVKNGIRFSGMPAFGRVESDEHVWSLVYYLRTLQSPPNDLKGSIAE